MALWCSYPRQTGVEENLSECLLSIDTEAYVNR